MGRDNALKAIIKKYLMQSGDDVTPIPAPEPSPNTYDVDVKVVGGNVRVMAGSRALAMVPAGCHIAVAHGCCFFRPYRWAAFGILA